MLFGLCALGQQVSTDIFTATAPAGATKLTGQPLADYLRANYKKTLVPSNQENTYLADGVIVCFWGLPGGPVKSKPLEEMQTRMVTVLQKNNTVNYARIETINNIRFLIYEYESDGEVYIRYWSDPNSKGQNLSGITQFKTGDKEKARQDLKDLLTSMHFKEQ
ncbi:MAG: hypothetical protein ABJA76_15055 [Mucilaginibacter sp.]